MSPPTRCSASTARPSWVSSWPARPLASTWSGWCAPLTWVTTWVPTSWWSSASTRADGDPAGGGDQEVAVRHHHAGAALADLDVGLEVGGERPVAVELGLRRPRTNARRRATAPARGVGGGPGVEDALGLVEQRRRSTVPYSSMLSARNSSEPRQASISSCSAQLALLGQQEAARASGPRRRSTGTCGEPLGGHARGRPRAAGTRTRGRARPARSRRRASARSTGVRSSRKRKLVGDVGELRGRRRGRRRRAGRRSRGTARELARAGAGATASKAPVQLVEVVRRRARRSTRP